MSKIIYVDSQAKGSGDGSSWGNALPLLVINNDEFWAESVSRPIAGDVVKFSPDATKGYLSGHEMIELPPNECPWGPEEGGD